MKYIEPPTNKTPKYTPPPKKKTNWESIIMRFIFLLIGIIVILSLLPR